MAENAVAFLLVKLGELLSTKLDLIRGVDIKILSLCDKLEFMRAFLKDADARRRDNKRVKVWVDRVRDVAFRAEDAIDRYVCEMQCQRHAGLVGSLKNYFAHSGRLSIRYQLGGEIEEISQMLQEITDSRSTFGIDLQQFEGESSSSYSIAPWQRNGALVEETNVIGFDRHVTTLVNQLTNEERGDVVLPIVGMGGLGKTTLARSVYNHADVNRCFECQAWVYVSQKYRRRELLMSMMEDLLKHSKEKLRRMKEDKMEKLDKDELERMTEIEMENKLKGYLQGKRYLLVVDDIWEVEAWNYISRALPDEHSGRGIILTTRNEEVAKCVDPTAPPYKMEKLGEADSWKLFCSKIFKTDECIGKELADLGMKMVRKCAGLPLAITVLGGLLSRKPKSDIEWTKVLKRIAHELHEREDGQSVRRILALSYDDLPYYLRSCFLYLGLFPEDSEIDVEKLTQRWVAEGFIQARGEQTMEEVAADYVEELVDRCMIQVVERNSWGGVASCRIHDLLFDLSISQGKEDKFLGVLSGNLQPSNAYSVATPRRVAIHGGSISECMTTHQSSPSSLRSLLCFNSKANLSQVRLLVNHLKLLRMLDLKGAEIRKLPKQIGGMVLLRYLGLEDTQVRELPSSIGKLHNLQTLRVERCFVPDVVWKIETLRHVTGHLLMMRWTTVHCNCKGDLQTLWGITAGGWVGRALSDLTNLRALYIWGILGTHIAMLSSSLEKLTRLNRLQLDLACAPYLAKTVLAAIANHPVLYEVTFTRADLKFASASPSLGIAEGYLNLILLSRFRGNLEFPPSLTRLELWVTLFSKQEELASLESLPNLKILELGEDAYIGKEMDFPPHKFTKLQELHLCKLKELEQWTIGDGSMPCLKRLKITRCEMLKMLPEGLQHITTLQQLELQWMPKAFTQRIQEDKGEDWYKVQHIPSVIITGPDYLSALEMLRLLLE